MFFILILLFCFYLVIRSPHLYPPSPRSSVVSVTSISSTRRASSTSNLSKVSATAFSSATQEQSTSVMIEDLEDPPPPYPGIIASTYTDLDVQIHSRTNDAYFHRNSCHGNTEERDDISRNINNVDENAPENQINYNNLQTSITSINIPVNSRRNRSSSHGNVLQRDTRLPNHRHHRNSVHSIGGNHSDHAHKSSCPGSNRRSCSGRASRSGRARSVSFVLSPNFLLLPTQAWDQYPRELSFVCCQSNSPHLGTRPSQWSTRSSFFHRAFHLADHLVPVQLYHSPYIFKLVPVSHSCLVLVPISLDTHWSCAIIIH